MSFVDGYYGRAAVLNALYIYHIYVSVFNGGMDLFK